MKKKLKSIVMAAVIIASIAVILSVSRQGGEEKVQKTIAVGLKAPDFSLQDSGGKLWRLSDMKGSVVLINFWATWCQSCRQEMPSLQNLYNNTAGRGIRIVTVLYRDDPENAASYFRENKFNMPVLIDSLGSASEAYGLTGIPETFIVDGKGMLREKILGPVKFDSPEVAGILTRLQGE